MIFGVSPTKDAVVVARTMGENHISDALRPDAVDVGGVME